MCCVDDDDDDDDDDDNEYIHLCQYNEVKMVLNDDDDGDETKCDGGSQSGKACSVCSVYGNENYIFVRLHATRALYIRLILFVYAR